MVKVDFGFIDSVLQKYDCDKTRVIAIMQEIQNEYKFLPKDALKYVAEKVDESEAELYGVATFYENFSMNEKGKYIIKVCNGTACHVRKSDDVQEAIYAATGLTPEDHISSDGLFTIERVSCLGACGLAPVCTVNDVVHASMTPEKVHALVQELKEAENS
ncbi:nADH dehydrogenase (Ubiquinone) 24 kDa subunit [Firmicutes bacterium CAG:240]|nr:nADH dehydrogenase (Ubiquinone) 24 kDa subunit [Firmicutes bacterium CAG:240]